MKTCVAALAAAALAFTDTQAIAQGTEKTAPLTAAEKGAAKFAELTQGRVAGEPKSCVSALRSNDVQVIEHVGIAYKAGKTLWIARARDARSLGPDDVPIIERFGGQLCREDVIQTVDRYTHFTTGSVFLDSFVPYTKVESEDG